MTATHFVVDTVVLCAWFLAGQATLYRDAWPEGVGEHGREPLEANSRYTPGQLVKLSPSFAPQGNDAAGQSA